MEPDINRRAIYHHTGKLPTSKEWRHVHGLPPSYFSLRFINEVNANDDAGAHSAVCKQILSFNHIFLFASLTRLTPMMTRVHSSAACKQILIIWADDDIHLQPLHSGRPTWGQGYWPTYFRKKLLLYLKWFLDSFKKMTIYSLQWVFM